MAKHSQHSQGIPATGHQPSSGGRQTVVELCEVSGNGLVLWCRSRSEIGDEVQVRLKRSVLPAPWQSATGKAKWVTLRGWVVSCAAMRREDGVAGFKVSLLIEQIQPPKVRSKMRWLTIPFAGHERFGLN